MIEKFKTKKDGHSILSRVMMPTFLNLFLIIAIYSVIFMLLFIVPRIDENAANFMQEVVSNKEISLELEMVNRWANISEVNNTVADKIELLLNQHNSSLNSLKDDSYLEALILEEVSEDILYLLRKNAVTESFIVLNNSKDTKNYDMELDIKSGLYFRSLEPDAYSKNNEDILMLKGPASIAHKQNLGLDAVWSKDFVFYSNDDETIDNELFYYQIMDNTKDLNNEKNVKPDNYGYWSKMHKIPGDYVNVMTYTVPIIGNDGTIYGVLVVGIDERNLKEKIDYNDISPDRTGAYLLAVTDEDRKHFDIIEESTFSANSDFDNIDILKSTSQNSNGLYDFIINGKKYSACIRDLNLYSPNTPMHNEQWVLIGLQPESSLYSFSNNIKLISFVVAILSLSFGIITSSLSAGIVTKPIQDVVNGLIDINPNKKVRLKKTNIKEIDMLTDAIENYSKEVLEYGNKISKIIDLTESPIGFFEYKEEGDTVYCTSSLFRILDCPHCNNDSIYLDRDEFNQMMERYFPEEYFSSDIKTFKEALSKENMFEFEDENNEIRWIELRMMREEDNIMGAIIDITNVVRDQEKIRYERDYDVLTGIYNRRTFGSIIDELFEKPEELKTAALMICDLDNLKYVNDTYGYEMGDAYIRELSLGLKDFEKHNAVIARYSGDEFYTFIYGYNNKDEINLILEEVWNKIKNRYILLPNGKQYPIRISGGVAWYPQDSLSFDTLLKYANFTMFNVKHSKKGILMRFDRDEYEKSSYLVNGQEALTRLIEKEELSYALQPIWDVKNSCVLGYEMLMRSDLPVLSSPYEILNMAKSQSKLHHIERLTWFKAMNTFTNHVENKLIPSDSKVFINTIASHIMTKDEFIKFKNQYEKYLENIVIEVTESEEAKEDYILKKNAIVRSWGGQIAIDDFGSGYSNERALISYHPDIIKIDISIIRNINSDTNKQKLFENLVSYAKARNIKILAEGVETIEEIQAVIERGADYLQGYYLAKPEFEIRPIPKEIVDSINKAKRDFKVV